MIIAIRVYRKRIHPFPQEENILVSHTKGANNKENVKSKATFRRFFRKPADPARKLVFEFEKYALKKRLW